MGYEQREGINNDPLARLSIDALPTTWSEAGFMPLAHGEAGIEPATLSFGSASQAQVDADVVKLWPKAQAFGLANEEVAFTLKYADGREISHRHWSARRCP